MACKNDRRKLALTHWMELFCIENCQHHTKPNASSILPHRNSFGHRKNIRLYKKIAAHENNTVLNTIQSGAMEAPEGTTNLAQPQRPTGARKNLGQCLRHASCVATHRRVDDSACAFRSGNKGSLRLRSEQCSGSKIMSVLSQSMSD